MLKLNISTCTYRVWCTYFNTSHVEVKPLAKSLLPTTKYFNTSHVEVKRVQEILNDSKNKNFNTSHVEVKRSWMGT